MSERAQLPVNEIVDGVPYPCKPIGCDNGHHLPGCVYASVDCEDPWHSAPGETAPAGPCPTCGPKGQVYARYVGDGGADV